MSATLFCPQCGTKNDPINGRKANFCCSCGTNLQSLAAFIPSVASTRPASSGAVDYDYSHEPQRGRDVGAISRADVEIIVQQQPKLKVEVNSGNQTLQMSGASLGSPRHSLGAKAERKNGEEVFKSFKKEAGSGGTKGTDVSGA